MSDEEKKAIERIDYIQDFIIENGQYNADVNDMEYFSKVLNLIEKQSKEIEEYKKQLDLDYVDMHFVPIERYNQLEKEIEELKESKEEMGKVLDEWINGERTSIFHIHKDKIKAKIEEIEKEIKVKREIAKNPMDRVSGRLLTDSIVELEKTKKVLQSLLEKE